MAQWSRADRTLHAKVVYYGPAYGGKTSNLEALHRITDPTGAGKLVALETADDRTLFFDLLPFDLGDILGYQVSIKLYTVPGQVRYETTRQVVLGGTDAIVFVADSNPEREEQNRWSAQNLQLNMRAKGIDPKKVPVLFQFNKQDLPNAASPEQVAGWFRLRAEQGLPAVAIEGRGVLETFRAATGAMLQRLVGLADARTRSELDPKKLREHLVRAFAPFEARRAGEQAGEPRPRDVDRVPVVLDSDDLLQASVQSSVELGEKLVVEAARTGRLERELDALRRLAESMQRVGASFDAAAIVEDALDTVAQVVGADAVSLLIERNGGSPQPERTWREADDPLLACEEGRAALERIVRADRPCLVDDFAPGCGGGALRACVAAPLASRPRRWLLAHSTREDGRLGPSDVRFVASVASHLATGLEKTTLYEAVSAHRDRLGELVQSRTRQLRRAYEDLRGLERTKDRFLNSLSHEMKTPLTAILSSALFLRDYRSGESQRGEMVAGIVESAGALERLLEDLFRASDLEDPARPLDLSDVTAETLARDAVQLSGHRSVRCRISGLTGPVRLDAPRLARALANLIDNGVKFSPAGRRVELMMRRGALRRGSRETTGLIVSVLDRGPGIAEQDRERVFAPFEQGGDPLTGKPEGIGLGLYEARVIAAQHGGVLEYRPRDGGGSEFRLAMPLRRARSESEMQHAAG